MTTTTITTEDRIRAAYNYLADRTGQWISLTDVRLFVQDLPRSEQDRALRNLMRDPSVRFVPWEKQDTLTRDDRDAALYAGDQWKHRISIW